MCLIVVLESATQVIFSWNTVGTNEASDATRMRQQRHDLECTPGAFEAEGREFESLRARYLKRILKLGYAAFSESGSRFPASFLGTDPRIGGAVCEVYLAWRVYGDLAHTAA